MRHVVYIFGLFILASCQQSKDNDDTTAHPSKDFHMPPYIPETSDKYGGITILNKGPRGGGYIDPGGQNLGYRIFRVHIINDSIIPIDFDINFASDSKPLRPMLDGQVKAFLFPHSMTPDKQDELDFGITGLISFLDTALRKPTMLKITIQPTKDYVFYIGVLIYNTNGSARAKLIADGQNLIYKIDINDTPFKYAEIQCGHLRRNESERLQ